MIPVMIVPVLNRYDLLERMIKSIDFPIGYLLVIDNGGVCYTMHNSFVAKTSILRLPSNLGVAASWNLGIKLFPMAKFWTFSSADVVFESNALKNLFEGSASDRLSLTELAPHYQAFSIGDQVIDQVGLFDESFYPIYFEDNDFERRVRAKNLEVAYVPLASQHDNSSTINSDQSLYQQNSRTFISNADYFNSKKDADDYSAGSWSLKRRRENNWEYDSQKHLKA